MQATTGSINPVPCPEGFYCLAGTANYGVTPCPTGMWSGGNTGLKTSTECTQCTDKFHCPKVAMSNADPPTNYPCMDGYLCNVGSQTVTGSDTCPEDFYCTAGTQTQCSDTDATFSAIRGITSQNECIKCAPGKICPTYSVGQYDCPAGNYCPGGHKDLSTIVPCTPGHYCPLGSHAEQ